MAFTPGSGAVISFTVDGASTAQRQIAGIGNSMGELSTAAKSSLKELAAFAGIGLSLGALADRVIGAQRDFDKLNAALITATGSSQSAADVFKSLQSFAATTPYSVAQAAEAFVKLKNMGLDPSEKALRAYGNTAAAMGKDLDQMVEAVADAATGEFERLKEFGITASQAGDKVSLTFKGTTTSVGKSADEIQAYLLKIGNTDFAGAMELRAATLDGAISNLADKWDAFVLKMSQSGIGDAAKGGIELLANNLLALAGAVATVAAAKLASTIDSWVTATRKQIVETTAARAASIAAAEADVASTAAKSTQLGATQAMIVVAREEAIAKLSGANASITSARAAITAAEAAGAQSYALRTVRLATADLQVAEAQRAAALAELAILGRQQAAVSAQITIAEEAQLAAQNALNASTAVGVTASGLATRAITMLGGPLSAIVTVLGIAATAWSWYKQKQDEATADAEQKVGKSTAQVVAEIEKQNEKLRERIELSKQAGMGPAAAQGGEAVERMAETLKKINELKAQGANISVGDSIALIDYQGMYNDLEKVVNANKDLKGTLDASGKSATDLREKLTGVTTSYVTDLATLARALDEGKIKQDEYNAAVKKLAIDTFNGSLAGKEFAKGLDLASEAIKHQADVAGVLNERQKEHIAYLQRIGQINDEMAVKQIANADVKGMNDKMKALEGELSLAKRKTDSEKEQAALSGQIDVINKQIAARRAKEKEDLFELEQKSYRQATNNSADIIEKEQAELASLRQQTQAQLDQNEQIGLTTKQVAALAAARLEEAAARKDAESIIAEGLDLTGERAQRIRDEAAALRERASAVVAGAAKQELFEKNLQDLNAMVDIMSALDEAAQSAAQGMANAFGSVGQAIGGMTTALTGYERTQAAIAAQLAAATKDAHGDPKKVQQANEMAAEASAQAQIKSYGDMASAAKGFFKENTAGYKVMQGAEKAFRAYEMAMALETMAKKIFFKETEVAANMTLNGTKIAGEATATAASATLAATEASAWGVTAVVKAIASLPFPLNLAAGAATLAAVVGLGVSMAGGMGGKAGVNPNSAEERQKVQGTGTVLGDPTAKSESMAHSLEIMQKNSDLELDYQNSMLSELKNISSALGGAAKGILQTTGITGGSAFGTVALAENNLIGASHTKDITDSGVQFAGTFGQMRSGTGLGRQYETVHTTSDGGMFRSGWSRDDTNYKALSVEAMKPFAMIFDNMGNLLVDAGTKLGKDGATLTSTINNISVDFGVSLRGLTGDALTAQLDAGISAAFDKVTTQLFPTIEQFRKVGEGLGETLVRVASDVQGLDSVFGSMGKSVGGMSIDAKERLVDASGGLEKFASSAKSFMQNFYSEAERMDATKAKLNPVLAQFGLTTEGPNAQKMFRDFVLGLNVSTQAGAETYAMLMNLQQAFFDVTDAANSERKDLQDQLDQLTMTQTQLLEKQRYALAEANRPLFDMVQAAQKLADTSSSMAKFRDAAKSLGDSLVTGSLSTLTAEQQYQELRNQYEKTKSAALAGDTKAQDALSSSLTAFLTASQKLNSGDSQYQADFAMAQQDSAAAASWASQQVDVSQAQLSVMNSQAASLNTANTSLQTLVDTVKELKAANAALTQEIAGLRADQQRQTGDSIATNVEGQQQAAQTIVSGLGGLIGKAIHAVQKVELE